MALQALADKFEGARGKLFAGATAAAVALPLTLGGLAATANDAYAQDASVQQASITQIETLNNREIGILLKQAGEYGRSGEGIGALVMIGDNLVDQGLTPEQAGQIVVSLLQEHGAPAKAFVGYNGEQNSGITFFTKNNSFGPLNVDRVLSDAPSIAKEFIEEQSVASLQIN